MFTERTTTKFGKVPSLTARMHKNELWQTSGALLKGYIITYVLNCDTIFQGVLLFGKVPSLTSCETDLPPLDV